MPKPLSPRNRAKLTPLINSLTCIACDRPCTGFPHDDGQRSYNYDCPCGAFYRFRFRRNNWHWSMILEFEVKGRLWRTHYEPLAGKTSFLRWPGNGACDFYEREFQGYVHHERFANLLVFA